MNLHVPNDWATVLKDEIDAPYFTELARFVEKERAEHTIYPPHEDMFAALKLTSFANTRALILGQDPYHGPNQAHGLAFSVRPGIALPPSLRNIIRELETDINQAAPSSGCLEPWAKQGVLLLNVVLTVRAGQANSHAGHGWEKFTDAIIKALSDKHDPIVFVLWGNPAQKKLRLIDQAKHRVVAGAHPSPLSAHKGFFGSRPFSQVNNALMALGKPPIDWHLP